MEEIDRIYEATKKMSKELDISVSEILRTMWDVQQTIYDKEDIEQWLEEEEYEYTDGDVQKIYEAYRSNADCNFGTWDNIARAYDRTDLKLRRRL